MLFEGGALEALRPDGVVALMATCPPAAVEAINERVRQAGRRLIDAPVSGGVAGAKTATLTMERFEPKKITISAADGPTLTVQLTKKKAEGKKQPKVPALEIRTDR